MIEPSRPPHGGAASAEQGRDLVEVLGARIDRISAPEALARIEGWIAQPSRRPRHVISTGFHGIWVGHQDPAFRRILNQADLFLPDGIAPVWLSRLRGDPLPGRAPGAEVVRLFLERADQVGYSSYFYGDTPATLEQLRARVGERFPGHRIAGTRSPPFRTLTPAEDAADIARINASGADVLWVGLGLPKQERWIAEHLDRLDVPVVVGVGAIFGFLSGKVQRVPRWLGEAGFEWLWRLAMEPRKLWRRDLIDGPQFLYHGLRDAFAHRLSRRARRARPSSG